MSKVFELTTTLKEPVDPKNCLGRYLVRHGSSLDACLESLTPDASTRQYFRIRWKGKTAVAAVYPNPFDPDEQTFLDITRLLQKASLPVPEILDIDGDEGVIVQEDLGDRQLHGLIQTANDRTRVSYNETAFNLIVKIQTATQLAKEENSIASCLAFDEEKLSWELNFFFEHYFKSLRGESLASSQKVELRQELEQISRELSAVKRVLCHRDFHTANLMVDSSSALRVIDYQDARMGPASYDLVSFLLDRQPSPPSDIQIKEWITFFLREREKHGLEYIDENSFTSEFHLMTLQRELKATGTFSYQTAVNGRHQAYLRFIDPTLHIVLRAAEKLDRFPSLQRAIRERISL